MKKSTVKEDNDFFSLTVTTHKFSRFVLVYWYVRISWGTNIGSCRTPLTLRNKLIVNLANEHIIDVMF